MRLLNSSANILRDITGEKVIMIACVIGGRARGKLLERIMREGGIDEGKERKGKYGD